MNALLLALEERGQPASWPNEEGESLAVRVDGEGVRFSLCELTDSVPHVLTRSEARHSSSAPRHDYKPTGRLQLQITNLPLYMGPIRRTWADGKQQRIENCIGDFIVALRVASAAMRANRQETEARRREREEERKREEDERLNAEERQRKAELITELIERREEAGRFREFAQAKPPRSITATLD